MDPNQTLKELLEMVAKTYTGEDIDAQEIAEHFEALHFWICRGGFLPKQWEKKVDSDKFKLYQFYPYIDDIERGHINFYDQVKEVKIHIGLKNLEVKAGLQCNNCNFQGKDICRKLYDIICDQIHYPLCKNINPKNDCEFFEEKDN